MNKIKVLDLFAGIGGFSLGLHKASERYETIAFAEQNKFCQKVLNKNFPDVKIYDDVKNIETIDCDLITAGFPCPAFSSVGKEGGFEQDDLFFEIIRIAKINKPKLLLLENVTGFANKKRNWRQTLINEIKNIGYETQDFIFDGRDFGILQCRSRYFAICHRDGLLYDKRNIQVLRENPKSFLELLSNPNCLRKWETPTKDIKKEWSKIWNESKSCGVFNGISNELDGSRKQSLGNAVIPTIITSIGKTLINYA